MQNEWCFEENTEYFFCLFAYVGNIKSQLNLKRSRSVLTEKIWKKKNLGTIMF